MGLQTKTYKIQHNVNKEDACRNNFIKKKDYVSHAMFIKNEKKKKDTTLPDLNEGGVAGFVLELKGIQMRFKLRSVNIMWLHARTQITAFSISLLCNAPGFDPSERRELYYRLQTALTVAVAPLLLHSLYLDSLLFQVCLSTSFL